jgi:hypothetical protein
LKKGLGEEERKEGGVVIFNPSCMAMLFTLPRADLTIGLQKCNSINETRGRDVVSKYTLKNVSLYSISLNF